MLGSLVQLYPNLMQYMGAAHLQVFFYGHLSSIASTIQEEVICWKTKAWKVILTLQIKDNEFKAQMKQYSDEHWALSDKVKFDYRR